ncbi:MAG TPA: 3-dehydroquinate synthase [Bacteroidales bacterium]|nr:3-dehydroquinate synthase [Bacteroidales bacterium]
MLGNKSHEVLVSRDTPSALSGVLSKLSADKLFLLADEHTMPLAHTLLRDVRFDGEHCVPAGESCKSVESLLGCLSSMESGGLTRSSVLLNFGGGSVSDLGGFAGAVFKRGLRVVNVATTLLAAVDASIGGKTGVNYMGLKNELGVVRMPASVIVSVEALSELPNEQWLSGYGEVVKYSLMMSGAVPQFVRSNDVLSIDSAELETIITECANFKLRVVARDPHDTGYRHILNLGHTVAHGIEAYEHERGNDIPHGIAVGRSLPVVAYISYVMKGYSRKKVARLRHICCEAFGLLDYSCKDVDRIIEYMHRDKKNIGDGHIRMVLLDGSANVPDVNCEVPESLIREAIDFYC